MQGTPGTGTTSIFSIFSDTGTLSVLKGIKTPLVTPPPDYSTIIDPNENPSSSDPSE
jgi:hypothetical protein